MEQVQTASLIRRPFSLREAMALVVLVLLAGTLLFWNLGRRYLWQDEAATAVLAERLLEFGRPLGYDGRNLITMDVTADRDRIGFERRIRDPDAAIEYYVARGDFKADTTWIGQPWGQFVLAAASLQALGHNTLAARLPFAMCGLITVFVLYFFARREFDDPLLAWIAAFVLATNVFWVLHMRQCRYYAPSSLLLLLTFITYMRWQQASRFGAVLFILTAWTWFQFDYGTFWPVVGVLAVGALLSRDRPAIRSLAVFALLGACVAPWVVYYELLSRLKETIFGWQYRLGGTIFNFNQYVIPLVLLAFVGWLVWHDWQALTPRRRQSLLLAAGILIVQLVWVPLVAPAPYHRYIVTSTPFAALLLAYGAIRASELLLGEAPQSLHRSGLSLLLAFVLVATPVFSAMSIFIIPRNPLRTPDTGSVLRSDWRWLYMDLTDQVRDPNREVVEFLRTRLAPDDEILITYEDIPLMFYLPQRIRGGISCFRLLDSGPPPRFFVNRSLLPYLDFQTQALSEYLGSAKWAALEHDIPDLRAGNCPDPAVHFAQDSGDGQLLLIAVRVPDEGTKDSRP